MCEADDQLAERRKDTEFASRLSEVRARAAVQAVARVVAVLERAQIDGPGVDAWVSALDIRDALRPTDKSIPSENVRAALGTPEGDQ